MRFHKHSSGSKGFSLVELMIVVAIIGVLAALAVPRFQSFQAKARQSEAKTNLSHIYTLEQSYYGDHDTFDDVTAIGLVGGTTQSCAVANQIGFFPQPCAKVRYQYVVASADTQIFRATATSPGTKVVPGCTVSGTTDTWTIDETKDLQVTVDAVALCK